MAFAWLKVFSLVITTALVTLTQFLTQLHFLITGLSLDYYDGGKEPVSWLISLAFACLIICPYVDATGLGHCSLCHLLLLFFIVSCVKEMQILIEAIFSGFYKQVNDQTKYKHTARNSQTENADHTCLHTYTAVHKNIYIFFTLYFYYQLIRGNFLFKNKLHVWSKKYF